MSNEVLIGIICALVGAHYISMVWEIRKVRDEIHELTKQVNSAAIAAANAATAAAQLASKK